MSSPEAFRARGKEPPASSGTVPNPLGCRRRKWLRHRGHTKTSRCEVRCNRLLHPDLLANLLLCHQSPYLIRQECASIRARVAAEGRPEPIEPPVWVGLVLEASSTAGSCQHQHPPGSAPLILVKASEGGKKIKKHEHKFVSILPEGAAFARQLSTGRRGRLLSPINLQAPGPARKETARISERRRAAPPTNVSSRKINHGETKQPPAEHDEMRDTR